MSVLYNVVSRHPRGSGGQGLTLTQVVDITGEEPAQWERIWTGDAKVFITNHFVIVEQVT